MYTSAALLSSISNHVNNNKQPTQSSSIYLRHNCRSEWSYAFRSDGRGICHLVETRWTHGLWSQLCSGCPSNEAIHSKYQSIHRCAHYLLPQRCKCQLCTTDIVVTKTLLLLIRVCLMLWVNMTKALKPWPRTWSHSRRKVLLPLLVVAVVPLPSISR